MIEGTSRGSDLTATQRAVLGALCNFSQFTSVATLAEHLVVADSVIERDLNTLVSLGLAAHAGRLYRVSPFGRDVHDRTGTRPGPVSIIHAGPWRTADDAQAEQRATTRSPVPVRPLELFALAISLRDETAKVLAALEQNDAGRARLIAEAVEALAFELREKAQRPWEDGR